MSASWPHSVDQRGGRRGPIREHLQYGLSGFRTLFLAGERLDPDTYHWAADMLGIPVIDHWWQTETGWPIVANPMGLELLLIKPGSPTVPVPGYDVQVLTPNGDPAPTGTEGELVIKLPLPPGTLPTVWGDNELPADFPPWQAVHAFFKRWNARGLPHRLVARLRGRLRVAQGRNELPTACSIDSQSVKAAHTVGAASRGPALRTPGLIPPDETGVMPPDWAHYVSDDPALRSHTWAARGGEGLWVMSSQRKRTLRGPCRPGSRRCATRSPPTCWRGWASLAC